MAVAIVVVGEEAMLALKSPAFRKAWSVLHAECPWATVFQSPEFVLRWYDAYESRFEPVIVHRVRADGILAGLLLLARDRASGGLVHAGADLATYHGWLARAADAKSFPLDAIAALAAKKYRGTLTFRHVAPHAPLAWLPAAEATGISLSVRWSKRGLMRLGPGNEVPAPLQQGGNENHIARLGENGPVSFTQLDSKQELAAIIDVVATQFDVREGARNGARPFRSDPLRSAFYLKCMEEPGLVHATVLRVGNEIAGAHVGFRDRVPALGVLTHAPWYAAHEPGKLLMQHLGKQLEAQGYSEFDLGPVGQYEQRLASRTDDVAVLEIHLDQASQFRHVLARTVAEFGKWVSETIGRDVTPALARARRMSSRLRLTSPRKIARVVARRILLALHSDREFRIYDYSLEPIGATPRLGVMKVNCLSDLLDYGQASASDPTLQQFLATSIGRLADGLAIFTHAENGLLLHYCWLTPVARQMGTEFGQVIPLPKKPAVLWDDYTHPSARGRGLHTESLRVRLAYAAYHGSTLAAIGVRADNGPSRHNIEKLGFRYRGSAWISTRMGRSRRWITWLEPADS